MAPSKKAHPQPSEQAIRAVKAIWSAVAQEGPDGKKVITFASRNDIVYLYSTGFVDENKYQLLEWVDAFKESLQTDGSYRLTEEQWMDKAKYRYCGPVGHPFDPMLIKEGDWPEKQLDKLFMTLLRDAVYFNEQELRSILEEAKPTFFKNGVYNVTKTVKEDLKRMVELYPSPAQVRALGMAEARAAQAGTGFTTGPAQSQVAAQRLSDLLSRSGGKS